MIDPVFADAIADLRKKLEISEAKNSTVVELKAKLDDALARAKKAEFQSEERERRARAEAFTEAMNILDRYHSSEPASQIWLRLNDLRWGSYGR
jgi:hypothetical protein